MAARTLRLARFHAAQAEAARPAPVEAPKAAKSAKRRPAASKRAR